MPRGDLGSKNDIKQNVLKNAILGGVYFIQKCQISKFVFDPLQTGPFGGALAPQGDLRSKNLPGQKVLVKF